MGEIFYEWNELGEATAHVDPGLQRAELSGDTQAMLAGYSIAGRLKLTAGDGDAAGIAWNARVLWWKALSSPTGLVALNGCGSNGG